MKVGISGKGGTGKTTISAMLARLAARRGYDVLAIDCDSNPNLGASLGLDPDVLAAARPLPKTPPDLPPRTAQRLVDEHGVAAPDGVMLLLAARIDEAAVG